MAKYVPQLMFLHLFVLNQMKKARLFTISDLNNLIPKGEHISADTIIRRARKHSKQEISCKRATKGKPAYWYIKNKAKQQEEASKNRDLACIKEIATRRDNNFITEALTK